MSTFGSPNPFFISGGVEEETTRSLRFNDDDTAYLTRTPSSAGNRKKWTFSAWIKRANLGGSAGEQRIFGGNANASHIYFASNDEITWDLANEGSGSSSGKLNTTQVFRDVGAWFHLVCALDTDNSTADNRMRMYMNGVEITDFGSRSNPTSGYSTNAMNNNTLHTLGYRTSGQGSAGMEFDGYMSEINFIDGQQYDASCFGETNVVKGQWIPKKYTGSYGTNGFYLKFADNSGTSATTLGKDSSGNDNNWTPNNFSVSAGAGNDSLEDSPNNNFCTINPLAGYSTTFEVPSNGNLDFSLASSEFAFSTFEIPTSGKWYAEVVFTTFASGRCGITNLTTKNDNKWHGIDHLGGEIRVDDSSVQSGLSPTIGDNKIVGIKVDRDAGTIAFTVDGSAAGTAVNISSMSDPNNLVFAVGRNSSGGSAPTGSINFGQRPFSHLPTDYKSLCSANLPDPTILLPNRHFDTLTREGNSTKDRNITGLNFKPSWVWIKSSSSSSYGGIGYHHMVWDVMRGAGADTVGAASRTELTVSANYEEGRGANYTDYYGHVSAFNSDGFTLDHISGQPAIYTNLNNKDYVGWSWNAGQTDGATYKVVVVSDSGNKYRFRNSADNATFAVSAVTLNLAEGGTYIFDQSDSSNAGHPLRFYTAADKSGGEYTTGVTTNGTAGQAGAYTQIVIAASAPTLFYQCSAHAGMGGQINTNSLLGSTNFDGDVTPADEVPTVKANPTAGFSMVTYKQQTGTYHIGHGLGVAPQLIITKTRSAANNWWTHTTVIDGTLDYGALDLVQSFQDSQAYGLGVPTSLVFEDDTDFTSDNADNIAYLFTSVNGYSKVGFYKGNGATDGTFVYVGFRIGWLMIKRTDASGKWTVYDNKRSPFNKTDKILYPNATNAQATSNALDFVSNGFKHRTAGNDVNSANKSYIYLALAEAPFKNARAR